VPRRRKAPTADVLTHLEETSFAARDDLDPPPGERPEAACPIVPRRGAFNSMSDTTARGDAEGWRARKQRLTRYRIAEAGMQLFLQRGFSDVTLDEIAAAAQISRRTFFHYFDSKEAIVEALDYTAREDLEAALKRTPPELSPLDAVRRALIEVVPEAETESAVAVDRLMRSTEALWARRQVMFARQEEALHLLLCERWPSPARRTRLRLVAMVGIGAMRMAMDQWRQAPNDQPMQNLLARAFDELRAEFEV
jgi:AcrR family transcriptional regulator